MMHFTLTRRGLTMSAVTAAGLGSLLTNRAFAAQGADGQAAIDTAVSQSRLETTSNIFALYQQMHSDARDEVPFYAVQHWYDTAFLPGGPEVIEPSGVTFIDWTWEVTGVMYPNTAEVSFSQAFADGTTVDDVVRLVEQDGAWRWFFGRSREFVDEQIALAEAAIFPDTETLAEGWVAQIVSEGEEALDRLPEDYPGDAEATLETGAGDGGDSARRYVVPREFYVLAAVDYQRLSPNQEAVDLIQDRLDQAARGPAFDVLAWDLSADADVVWVTYAAFANEAVGNAVFTLAASDETRAFWTVTALTQDVVDALGMALVR